MMKVVGIMVIQLLIFRRRQRMIVIVGSIPCPTIGKLNEKQGEQHDCSIGVKVNDKQGEQPIVYLSGTIIRGTLKTLSAGNPHQHKAAKA
jgi:hypothetical protein